jgi:hypothetical protein
MQMDVPIQQYLIFHWHEFTQLIYWAGNDHWYGFGDVCQCELVCMDEGERLLKWGGLYAIAIAIIWMASVAIML